MKILLSVFMCFLFTVISKSQENEYKPLPLHYMILKAELVIYGEIINVESDNFNLKITRTIIGNTIDSIVKIKQYIDWKCSSRWTKYSNGQKVLLFLEKNKQNEWEILSKGGEGEMPIYEDVVFIPACYSIAMPFCFIEEKGLNGEIRIDKFNVYKLYGSEYRGMEFKLSQVIDAITGLKNCFILSNNMVRPLIKKELIKTYKNKSNVHNWLAECCENK